MNTKNIEAFTIKYHGPTDRTGSRWRASGGKGTHAVVVSVDHALNGMANAAQAAIKFRQRNQGQAGRYVLGQIETGLYACVYVKE